MKNSTKLMYLLEVTRNMPQYGYALSGGSGRIGNLAEHHYLVTMIAWQIARKIKNAGGKINIERVFEFGLTHDLGELFGGDIAMPYVHANPEARKHAKAFEFENSKYLAKFFDDDEEYSKQLLEEILDADSDEALVVKVADYIEVTMYKQFIGLYSEKDIELIRDRLAKKLDKFSDTIGKKIVLDFIETWKKDISDYKTFDLKIKEIFGL